MRQTWVERLICYPGQAIGRPGFQLRRISNSVLKYQQRKGSRRHSFDCELLRSAQRSKGIMFQRKNPKDSALNDLNKILLLSGRGSVKTSIRNKNKKKKKERINEVYFSSPSGWRLYLFGTFAAIRRLGRLKAMHLRVYPSYSSSENIKCWGRV